MAAWISTLYLYEPESRAGVVSLVSSSQGVRGPSASGPWWPLGVGPESENVGSLVAVEALPTQLTLGVRFVAYGDTSRQLVLAVSHEATSKVVSQLRAEVRFSPMTRAHALGVASQRVTLVRVPIEAAGMYLITATLGEGAETQVPLYVALRSDWMEEKAAVPRLDAHAIPPGNPAES